MDSRLHFAHEWSTFTHAQFRYVVREFLDNGADRFVLTNDLLQKMLKDPEEIRFTENVCREMNVHFSMVHGFYGPSFDLNNPDPERRKTMFGDHAKGMEIAAAFGCKTYVVHVGAYAYCHDRIPVDQLRPLAVDGVEKLLPSAEKNGIILAVENSFEKPNSAKEVLEIIKPFGEHPFLGVCYDTGHAKCMESAGKVRTEYAPNITGSWWEEAGIEWEDNAWEKLRDHVVTCHIHDNNGYADLHGMPFDGITDWDKVMPELLSHPRMLDFNAEIDMRDGSNWAGTLLAPAGGYSIRKLVETFRKLGF